MIPAPAVDGPRVRLVAEGATVRDKDGVAFSHGARSPPARCSPASSAAPGPPVRLRVLASGRNVRANVTAQPYGEVELDGVAMGGTPLADLPLRAGTRRLAIRGPDGSVTRLTIEVGAGGEPDDAGGAEP